MIYIVPWHRGNSAIATEHQCQPLFRVNLPERTEDSTRIFMRESRRVIFPGREAKPTHWVITDKKARISGWHRAVLDELETMLLLHTHTIQWKYVRTLVNSMKIFIYQISWYSHCYKVPNIISKLFNYGKVFVIKNKTVSLYISVADACG